MGGGYVPISLATSEGENIADRASCGAQVCRGSVHRVVVWTVMVFSPEMPTPAGGRAQFNSWFDFSSDSGAVDVMADTVVLLCREAGCRVSRLSGAPGDPPLWWNLHGAARAPR